MTFAGMATEGAKSEDIGMLKEQLEKVSIFFRFCVLGV